MEQLIYKTGRLLTVSEGNIRFPAKIKYLQMKLTTTGFAAGIGFTHTYNSWLVNDKVFYGSQLIAPHLVDQPIFME